LHGAKLNGRALRVLPKLPKDSFQKGANLLIQDLHSDANEEELRRIFQQFGPVLSCKIERFKDGTSRGMAYVQFATIEQVEYALAKMGGELIHGKAIRVQLHKPWFERQQEESTFNNIFVRNLPKDYTEAALRAAFEHFGAINSLKVNNKTDSSIGFITY
jgi:polyadenylate-binding protein